MKKIILVILSLLFVLLLLIVFAFTKYRIATKTVDCSNQNRNSAACQKCLDNGGKIFMHSFGSNCEIEAKDVNKTCTYDHQCSKFNCVYENKDALKGYCDGYRSDNDGIMNCHRMIGNPIKCDFSLS